MTTKIAVITDVHANLPALLAAFRAIGQEGCDQIIHTGDAVGFGPFPNECLDALLALPNISLLMGNHDAWAVGAPIGSVPSWLRTHTEWTRATVSEEHRAVMAQWPYLLQQEIEGVKLTFLHYALDASGRNFMQIVFDPTPADLDQLFAPYASDLVFYGHYHPFSDMQGRGRYINPGTLGCHDKAIARYAIVTLDRGQASVEHRSAPYDDAPLFAAMEQRQVAERETVCREFFKRS
jgi:predicted phosphodiesterase